MKRDEKKTATGTPALVIKNSKFKKLIKSLEDMESAILAYSGGVDSAFLLKALQVSGIRTLAITADSEILPRRELLTAKALASELGMEHRIIEIDELSLEEFVKNTRKRCFICKEERFRKLTDIAASEGYRLVLDGSNRDDLSDYRPGIKAAKKYRVRSPLMEAGFSKKEIRGLSRKLGLPTWDKPSSSCLSTRIPYGQRITRGVLKRIEEAEDFLRSLGFHEVRVRDHGDVARIELSRKQISLVLNPGKKQRISSQLKSLGYRFVSLDLDGYRMGSMNNTAEEASLFS